MKKAFRFLSILLVSVCLGTTAFSQTETNSFSEQKKETSTSNFEEPNIPINTSSKASLEPKATKPQNVSTASTDSNSAQSTQKSTSESTKDYSDSYYVLMNGKPVGPYTSQELRSKLNAGEITHGTKVNKVGTPNWTPLSHDLISKSAQTDKTNSQDDEILKWYVLVSGTIKGPFSALEVK